MFFSTASTFVILTLQFPVILDGPQTPSQVYLIPAAPAYLNTSRTNAQWIPLPTGTTVNNYGSLLGKFPSAFLALRNVPLPSGAADVTCSIQANWAPGSSVGNYASSAGITMAGFLGSEGTANENFPPWLGNWATGLRVSSADAKHLRTWPKVEFTKSWLDLLTPQLIPHENGWTTLAATIDSVLSRQLQFSSATSVDVSDMYQQLNTIVASFFVDSMARVGIAENALDALDRNEPCSSNIPGCVWTYYRPNWNVVNWALIADKARLEPTPMYRNKTGQTYHAEFTVGGYGISSEGKLVAFAVLYAHTLLAIGHITYMVWKRSSIQSWSSPTELFTLSQSSMPPSDHCLRNTCAGIAAISTRKLKLRIRENIAVSKGEERLRLYVENNGGSEIREGESYGQKL